VSLTERSDRSRPSPWLFTAALLVVFAPLLTAAVEECRSTTARSFPLADYAVLEDAVLHAGRNLVGPYSQYDFRHPGPLLFWMLWPAYALSAHATIALHLTALLLNAACLGYVLFVCWRAATNGVERALGALAVVVLIRHLSGFVSGDIASAYPSAFTDIWNPVITLLPFAALTAACVEVALGSAPSLVLAIGLHAFVCQAHVGYVPVTSGMLVLAIAWMIRSRSSSSAEARNWLLWACALGLLLWSAPLYDAAFGSHNLRRIARFFASHRDRPTLSAALAHGVRQLQAPLLFDLGPFAPTAPEAVTRVASVFTVLEALLLALASVRGREPFDVTSKVATLALAGLLLALGSVLNVDPSLPLYPTAWFAIVGLFGWGVVFARMMQSAEARWPSERLSRPLVFVGAVLLPALSLREAVRTHHAYGEYRAGELIELKSIPPLAAGVERVARSRGKGVLLTVRDHDDWGLLAGLVLELDKRGMPPRIDSTWRFMFGAGHTYAKPSKSALFVSSIPLAQHSLATAKDGSSLYAVSERDRRALADFWVLGAQGAETDPSNLFAADAPAEGAPWNAPGAVTLKDTSSWILLGGNGARIDGIDVLADGNDTYVVEASVDGRQFQAIASVPVVDAPGLRWRRLTVEHPSGFPLLRIRPLSGDGFYSIASVIPRSTEWGVATLTSVPGALTVLLPTAPSEGAELTLRGPAHYTALGSIDCVDFEDAASFGAGAGSAPYVIRFPAHPSYRCLRVISEPALEADAVSRIRPLVVPDAVVVDLGVPSARPHLIEGWSGDEYDGWNDWVWGVGPLAVVEVTLRQGTAYTLAFDASPHLAAGQPQTVEVRLNGAVLGTVPLAPGVNEVRLRVPRELARAVSRLELRFAYALSPAALKESEDTRALSARFDRILFVETTDAN
jgi:hypothetical protein